MIGVTRPPLRKDAIATRERLVRAALELFTSTGYRGTTTLDLAGRADTAEATIYRHFAGKEALFNEAYRHALRWGVTVIRPTDNLRMPTKERLGRIARRLVEQVPKDAAMVLMMLRRPDGPELEDQTHVLAREVRENLTQLVATGKQEGAIRPGSAELWGSIWLAVVAFAVERIAVKEWTADHPSAAATLDAAWDAICSRPLQG